MWDILWLLLLAQYFVHTRGGVDIITTIVGTGAASYSGDGGAATSASLYYPFAVAVDTTGIY